MVKELYPKNSKGICSQFEISLALPRVFWCIGEGRVVERKRGGGEEREGDRRGGAVRGGEGRGWEGSKGD